MQRIYLIVGSEVRCSASLHREIGIHGVSDVLMRFAAHDHELLGCSNALKIIASLKERIALETKVFNLELSHSIAFLRVMEAVIGSTEAIIYGVEAIISGALREPVFANYERICSDQLQTLARPTSGRLSTRLSSCMRFIDAQIAHPHTQRAEKKNDRTQKGCSWR